MAKKKSKVSLSVRIANFCSLLMVIFTGASFVFETQANNADVNYILSGIIIFASLITIIIITSNSINHSKMAFSVPLVLLALTTALMLTGGWYSSHYLVTCMVLCAISCIYSGYNRTVAYIIAQNVLIGYLILTGEPVAGYGMPMPAALVGWVFSMVGCAIMLVLTRYATVILGRALEQQYSFRDLLNTTENYVAMINERNEVVYASKTLSQLGDTEEPLYVQGRPLIDLFPGRSLKVFAGKLLKEKENYAEDWEFTLNGQKRYFKAASHSLAGGVGTLISMYDMTHIAERDEIAVMKDSMKIGLFFIDSNYIIQDNYSRYLEELLSEQELSGRLFTEVIGDSVTLSELESIKDYFKMVLERSYDQEMLADINPLNELHYINRRTGDRKVLQFDFATVERGHGEVFILVTIYDITARIELQQRLQEEETRRQEEMQAVFELIQIEPSVFKDFMEDMENEFDNIDAIMKNEVMSSQDVLVKVYQSIHAIKSNAVILGLSIFGNKLHALESKIKKLREIEGDVPFTEMLNLTMDIEKVSMEREGFRDIIGKLQVYAGSGGGVRQNVKVLTDSLKKTAEKVAEDLEKQVKLAANDIDTEALDKGPRRVIKEILMQLVRNSVVHGIETPDVRKAKGKNETGIVKLSIKMTENHQHIHIKLSDDGKGLDYAKISEKAINLNMIKKEDANNKDVLIKAIFSPGFSTADTEGVHGGRGIGLNLVRDRIKEVNGIIKLHSEADKGTMFLVSIPVASSAPK